MSLKNAQEFLKEFVNNEELRTKVAGNTNYEEVKITIQKSGYSFTSEEIQTAIDEFKKDLEQDELSEDELSEISGGFRKTKKDKQRERSLYRLNQVNQVLSGLSRN